MKRPAQSCKVIFAAVFFLLAMMGIAGPASGAPKPKFVYVANSGNFQTFLVTAVAASAYPISGTFTLDLSTGQVISGSMSFTNPSNPLPFFFQGHYVVDTPQYLFFEKPGASQPANYVELEFPFTAFPANYSGGPLCVASSTPQPGCAAISGAGTSGQNLELTSGSVTLTGTPLGTGTISGYAIDATTGALTPLPGSPFTAGSGPISVALDPSSKFVYVANRLSNNVSAYGLNSSTGALTPVSGSPFSAGSQPYSVTVDPSGKFVYVANEGSNNVSAYTIDGITGALSPITGSPFAAGAGPVSVIVDPLDKFVYVTDGLTISNGQSSSTTSAYSINSETGVLTQISGSPFQTRTGATAATVDPSGKFLFEIYTYGAILGLQPFTINPTTGTLTEINTNGIIWADPSSVAVHPSGKFLYSTDYPTGVVRAFDIDSTTGLLTLIPGSPSPDYGPIEPPPPGPYSTGSFPNSIAIDPTGQFAYVANVGSNNVSAYAINDTTGALAPITGSPFAAGTGPSSVAIASSSTVPLKLLLVHAWIDEDRKTSFRVEGFFKLGEGTSGIDPVTESVELQLGSFSVTVPAGSFKEHRKREFEYEGRIDGADLHFKIEHLYGDEYLFSVEGRALIATWFKNPVSVGLTIGDDAGTANVKADIDK